MVVNEFTPDEIRANELEAAARDAEEITLNVVTIDYWPAVHGDKIVRRASPQDGGDAA